MPDATPKRTRVTEKKLERAAKLARETGQPVTVGGFTVHPPGAANDADDEGARVQKQLDAMGQKR
jgi:hypothetical protein